VPSPSRSFAPSDALGEIFIVAFEALEEFVTVDSSFVTSVPKMPISEESSADTADVYMSISSSPNKSPPNKSLDMPEEELALDESNGGNWALLLFDTPFSFGLLILLVNVVLDFFMVVVEAIFWSGLVYKVN